MNSIHSVLIYLRDSKDPGLKDRKSTHGICELLRFYVQNKDSCNEFLKAAFISIYEKYEPFPIEGDSKTYHKNREKWNPKTNHGKARLELLDKMIAFAEEEHSVLLSELNKIGL